MMIVAVVPQVDTKVYAFLLLCAILSLSKCLGALDCCADCTLFAAGVYGLVSLVKNGIIITGSHGDERKTVI